MGMYESPINLYMDDIKRQVVKQQEDLILKAVQNIAIGVDRDELIRALQYDRDQYEKGYQDAIAEKNLVEVVRCKYCKHFHTMEEGFQDCINPYGIDLPSEFDYCSYGERKDND